MRRRQDGRAPEADPNPLLANGKAIRRRAALRSREGRFFKLHGIAMAENLTEIDKIATTPRRRHLRTRLSRWNVWARP